MPIAADNATDRAQQLVALTDRLTKLMALEVQLLNEHRPGDISDFQDERSTLATIYSQELLLIKQDRSLIEGITRDLRDQLRDSTVTFQATLAAHGLVLQRMKTISEKIVKAVSDEVAKSRAPRLGYGKNAMLNARPSSASVPLAINQSA